MGGSRVTMGHAFAHANELKEWSWQQAVQARAPPGKFTVQAEACIMTDEAKRSLHDLMDVPEVSSKQNSEEMFCSEDTAKAHGRGTDAAHSNQPGVLTVPDTLLSAAHGQ